MMSKVKRVLWSVLWALLIVGCGKEEVAKEEVEAEIFYKNTVYEYKITQDENPIMYFMGTDGKKSYFICEDKERDTLTEDERTPVFTLCYEKDQGEMERITDIQGQVLAMNVSNDKETSIILVVHESQGKMIYEYDEHGGVLKSVMLPEEISMGINEIIKLYNGDYILNCIDSICVVDSDGKETESITSSNGKFRHVMYEWNGPLYCIIKDDQNKYFYSEINTESYRLGKEELLSEVTDVYYGMIQEGLLFWNKDGVYIYEADKNSFIKNIDFERTGIFGERIQSVRYNGDTIELLSWDIGKVGKRIEHITCGRTKSEETTPNIEETELTICVVQYMDETAYELEEFAKEYDIEHPEQNVKIEYVSSDKASMQFLAEKCPDLVYFQFDVGIENYQKNGYLTDLLPMLEGSSVEEHGGISSGLVNAFAYGGGLYVIPLEMNLYTICYIDDDSKEDDNQWTVDEYLTWLETHQGAKNAYFTKEAQLGAVILGNIDHYVNRESGEVSFNTDEFKSILYRLKDISLSDEFTHEEELEQSDDYIYAPSFSRLSMLADLQSFLETPVHMKGFPNDNGERVTFLSGTSFYAIPQNAKNKEEAFAFMEYVLLYPQYYLDSNEKDGIISEGALYSVDGLMKRSMDHCVGTANHGKEWGPDYTYVATEEMREDFYDAFQTSIRMDDFRTQILNIVVEESTRYFAGEVDLDTTCNVIQNRVSIYVQERGN